MALALPKFRWLLTGAVAAGVWVVREDMKAPRPPERVPTGSSARRGKAEAAEAGRWQRRTSRRREAVPRTAAERPVPPKPVMGKPVRRSTVVAKAAPQKTALLLPKPSTGRRLSRRRSSPARSAGRTSRPSSQTKTKVCVRAQARADAADHRHAGAGATVCANWRDRANGGWFWRRPQGLGAWRLSGAKPSLLPRRPKLPVAEDSRPRTAPVTRVQKALKVSVVSDRTMPGTLATCSLMNLPMSSSVSM